MDLTNPANVSAARGDLTLDGRVNNTDLGGLYDMVGQDARSLTNPPASLASIQSLPGNSAGGGVLITSLSNLMNRGSAPVTVGLPAVLASALRPTSSGESLAPVSSPAVLMQPSVLSPFNSLFGESSFSLRVNSGDGIEALDSELLHPKSSRLSVLAVKL